MTHDDPPQLHEVQIPSFRQAIQFARLFSSHPITPQNAALLSLLFVELDMRSSLKTLLEWLESQVATFINQSPRDQANQTGKVLIVASYIYSKNAIGEFLGLIQDKLYRYVNYASNQNWFENPFLAFYCHHLPQEVPIRGAIEEFFSDNLERFIIRQNVSALTQYLLVFDDRVNAVDQSRCCEIFTNSWQNASFVDLGWILLGLQNSLTSNSNDISEKVAFKLIEYLDASIVILNQTSVRLDVLNLIGSELNQEELEQFLETSSLSANRTESNDIALQLNFSSENTSSPSVDLFTYFLSLFSISRTGWSQFTGMYKAQRVDIITMIEQARISQGQLKATSRWELFVANVLTIFATSLIGIVLFGFFMNADMTLLQIDFSKVDWRNIDVIGGGIGLGTIGLLLTQIIALISEESAISHWLRITPIKQLVELINSLVAKYRKDQ